MRRGRVLAHIRRNTIAYLALFVAMGGTGYAASQLPKNSVGTKQIKNGAVTKPKVDPNLVSQLKGKNGLNGKNGINGINGAGTATTLDREDTGTTAPTFAFPAASTPPTPPGAVFYTKTISTPANTVLIVGGVANFIFHCPTGAGDCTITHGGAYLDSTPIPNTDPNQTIDVTEGADAAIPAGLSIQGALSGISAGTHTFKLAITQTTGNPVTTKVFIHGYAMTLPQGS